MGVIIAPVCIVFLMWSLDRVPKLYQLRLQSVNVQLIGKQIIF